MRRILTAGIALSACVLLHVAPAAAQQDQAPAPALAQSAQAAAQGPLVLEPIRSGYVIAPEARITRVDGLNHSLVGAYGGWLMDNSLLIGAGGYWLADNRRGTQHSGMYYGGFVAGWSVRAGRAVRVGGRALAGFGQATLPTSVTFATGPFPDGHMDLGHDAHGFDPGPVTTTVQQVRFHRGFAILEPQADLTVRLARRIWLDAGGGYRLIGNAGSFESRLRGAFGSVGVRFSAH